MDKQGIEKLLKQFEEEIDNMTDEEFEKFVKELGLVPDEEKGKSK